MALIAAVSWHFGSTRASKSASRGPKCPGTSTEHGVLGKTGAELRTRALAQKPGTDRDFLGKFGADLCGPEHLAKNPFPQSTVFLGKTGADLRGP